MIDYIENGRRHLDCGENFPDSGVIKSDLLAVARILVLGLSSTRRKTISLLPGVLIFTLDSL